MKRIFHSSIPFKSRLLPGSNAVIEKFINCVMRDGKKSIARRIVDDMFTALKKNTDEKPEELFSRAIENASPAVEVRPKRVGGGVYQVPVEVSPNRQRILSFRWIIDAARNGGGKPMAQRLAGVVAETAKNEGPAVKKKEEVHKMAAANKAFAHLAKY